MSKRNEPIGTVRCPHRDCDELAKVYRFRQRTEGRNSVFTGKLYADCPNHGRFGADGKAGMQDYILEKGTIWGPVGEKPPGESATADAAAPASPAPAPAAPRAAAAEKPKPRPKPKPQQQAPTPTLGWLDRNKPLI